MANILLTNVCNANCDFCFATELIQSKPAYLGLSDLQARIEFLLSSGISQIRLIGGEPTIHPQFPEFIEYIKSTDLDIVIFSNGYIPKLNLDALTNLPAQKLALLINVNAQHPAKGFTKKRLEVFRQLGNRVTLGYTIVNPIFNLSPYFEWINEFKLQRKIRLGLAQPNLVATNRYLSPKQYKIAAQSTISNAKEAYQQDIRLEFDCGFVHCMFTEGEWDLLRKYKVRGESHCAPNMDITLDGKIIYCFSVPNLSVIFDQNSSAAEALTALMQQQAFFNDVGIFPECTDCEYRLNHQCCAGCLSIRMRRFYNLNAIIPSAYDSL